MNLRPFRRMVLVTLGLTLFLIFVGGFVRASGSGLGCPDWPQCWGCWWPPSSLEEVDLPAVLEEFRASQPDLTEADLVELFNPTHLWIEYLNRLLGVLVGLSILMTLFLSLPLRKRHPRLLWGSLAAFLLVGFQGWLGALVVKSKLQPGLITLHLAFAIILFCVLIALAMASCERWPSISLPPVLQRRARRFAFFFFLVSALQIVLGAQVREAVDAVGLENAGLRFKLHRAFAWAVLLSLGGMLWPVFRSRVQGWRLGMPVFALALVLLQAATGWTLDHYDLPPVSQVLHLGAGCTTVCLAFFLILAFRKDAPLVVEE